MAKRKPREGWEESFAEAAQRGDLELTEEDIEWLNAPLSDDADWEWEFTEEELAQAPNMIFTSVSDDEKNISSQPAN